MYEILVALVYSGDIHRFDFYKKAQKGKHPYMTKNARDFFNWTIDEMITWERGVIAEQTPMILDTLNLNFASTAKRPICKLFKVFRPLHTSVNHFKWLPPGDWTASVRREEHRNVHIGTH
jgi:hypothetical protein